MAEFISSMLNLLLISLKTTLVNIFVLAGPGLVFVLLMDIVSAEVQKNAYRLMGRRIYLLLFGWPGAIVHESSHALMCIVFRHKITGINFFSPNPATGTLGSVSHSYNRSSKYQSVGNFFISIAPILLGSAVIYISAVYLAGDKFLFAGSLDISFKDFKNINAFTGMLSDVWNSFIRIAGYMISSENIREWQFYVFVYILFCIGSSITLSRSDLKGARTGFIAFFGLLFLINFLMLFFNSAVLNKTVITFTKTSSSLYTIMVFVLLMNVFILAFLYLIKILKSLLKRL